MPAAPKIRLPAGVRAGHVGHVPLPAPFALRQLIGQLVDVRDDVGNRYLLSETEGHWLLHRRLTPGSPGHQRNATHPISIAIAKNGE